MGQLALGFRSLAIRAAVFFMLAAALAWILGGTLFPSPQTADMPAVTFNGQKWFWRVSVGGDHPGVAQWSMMSGDKKPEPVEGFVWSERAGPVVHGDTLAYGGLNQDESGAVWSLVVHQGQRAGLLTTVSDRLELEHQLARIEAGLPLLNRDEIRKLRDDLLPPSGASTAPETR